VRSLVSRSHEGVPGTGFGVTRRTSLRWNVSDLRMYQESFLIVKMALPNG
jgi:hypothetical protein